MKETAFLDSIRAENKTGKYSILMAGVGVSKDRELALFTLGSHGAMSTTRLGRYGIGIKHNAISAGDVMEVESVFSDGHMFARVDWAHMSKLQKWKIDSPRWSESNGDPIGTEIKIRKLRWKPVKEKDIEETRSMLSLLFYPALLEKKLIHINGDPVPGIDEPALKDPIVDCVLEFPQGRRASVRAGALRDPAADCLRGINVSYKHRVVIGQGNIGCGGTGSYRRMFASVHLDGPWDLTRFKNDIEEQQKDELDEKLSAVLASILIKCDDEHMTVRDREIELKLNEMLPLDMQPARPPRKKPGEGSTKKKRKNKKNQKTQESEGDNGPARAPSRRGLEIRFEDNLARQFGLGRFLKGKPSVIELSKDCPMISELKKARDLELGAKALYSIAIAIYLSEKDQRPDLPGQMTIEGVYEPFGMKYWKILEQQPRQGGIEA